MATQTPTTATPAHNAAQVLAWEAEPRDLTAKANGPDTDEDTTDALIDKAADLECEIARAPCDSLTTALVKLRGPVRESLTTGCQYRIDEASLVDGIIEFLERPAEEARLPGFDAASLAALPGPQLAAVYDGLAAAREAVVGVLNQPRCKETPTSENAAGLLLDSLADLLAFGMEAAVEAAAARVPENPLDAEKCAWVRLKYAAETMDDLSEAAKLAHLLADQAAA